MRILGLLLLSTLGILIYRIYMQIWANQVGLCLMLSWRNYFTAFIWSILIVFGLYGGGKVWQTISLSKH